MKRRKGNNQLLNISDRLSPELKLLLACLRPQVTKEEHASLDALCTAPINWGDFTQLAVHHGVYPLVYQCINTFRHAALPPQVVAFLRQKSLENRARTLQITGELVKVLRAMEAKNIRVVVLKGFPLGHKLYGNMALRPSRDLDILVWPEDVDEARKLLETLGYDRIYPNFAGTPGQLCNWMKNQHHFNYLHKQKQVLLELHWQLGHHGMDMPLTYIKNSLTPVKIAGQSMYLLKTEELLLSLILHGASHKWFRLKWLIDVGIVLRQGAFSWQRLYELGERLDVVAILNQALILARQLLAAPVPDEVAAIVAKDRKAQNLAEMALTYIMAFPTGHDPNQKMSSYFHRKKYGLNLRCGFRRKFAFIHDHFLPTDADIALVALPAYLYFIYYLMRPLTWFGRRIFK